MAEGCSGVFADTGGYHYGRGDGYDKNARRYDEHGHDDGKMAAGIVAAVLVGAALESSSDKDKKKRHDTSNYDWSSPKHKHSKSGYDGCHGIGCMVDNPDQASSDQIDTRPQFDKDGNPNFDTKGNHQGCHGVGCDVDNPDSTD